MLSQEALILLIVFRGSKQKCWWCFSVSWGAPENLCSAGSGDTGGGHEVGAVATGGASKSHASLWSEGRGWLAEMGLKALKEQNSLWNCAYTTHRHVFLEPLSLQFWFYVMMYHYLSSLHKTGLDVCQREIWLFSWSYYTVGIHK